MIRTSVIRHFRRAAWAAWAAWILIAFFPAGCASVEETGVCRHNALYCAHILDETTQCEVVCGVTVVNNSHCQARCLINHKVEWIVWRGGYCLPGPQEYQFQKGRYLVLSVADTVAYLESWVPRLGKQITDQ
jgi:hypothetical protein